MTSTMSAPIVAPTKPAPCSGRYQPTLWPIHVATNAPAIPRTAVNTNPCGLFGPGRRNRAMMPATRPTKRIQINPLKTSLQRDQRKKPKIIRRMITIGTPSSHSRMGVMFSEVFSKKPRSGAGVPGTLSITPHSGGGHEQGRSEFAFLTVLRRGPSNECLEMLTELDGKLAHCSCPGNAARHCLLRFAGGHWKAARDLRFEMRGEPLGEIISNFSAVMPDSQLAQAHPDALPQWPGRLACRRLGLAALACGRTRSCASATCGCDPGLRLSER